MAKKGASCFIENGKSMNCRYHSSKTIRDKTRKFIFIIKYRPILPLIYQTTDVDLELNFGGRGVTNTAIWIYSGENRGLFCVFVWEPLPKNFFFYSFFSLSSHERPFTKNLLKMILFSFLYLIYEIYQSRVY